MKSHMLRHMSLAERFTVIPDLSRQYEANLGIIAATADIPDQLEKVKLLSVPSPTY